MSKQPPADLAWEQSAEAENWLIRINQYRYDALIGGDYATIAHLHRKLAGVMREYQKFRMKQETLKADVIQHMIDEAKKEEASE